MNFQPRPAQKKVLAYRKGFMGVTAVPGSGKTWTLSLLASQLIAENRLADDQEVLVVTLVNSAVDNFTTRIRSFLEEQKLLPSLGYRVRTLHGLAHDIVSERPGLVGLPDHFEIIDESSAERILQDIVLTALRTVPDLFDNYLDPQLDPSRLRDIYKFQLPKLLNDMTRAFIKRSKDLQLTPQHLRTRLRDFPAALPLVEICTQVYHDYQRALEYRGAVDFDDLIRLAADALERDQGLVDRLRNRWPYILEDEAQDSSRLQEVILRQLAGPEGNWVRVGDPNQAIYETFTTANPDLLRSFVNTRKVRRQALPNSGRSSLSIITLANELIRWTLQNHPVEALRSALDLPYIAPAPKGDPQPNPTDDPLKIFLVPKKFKVEKEEERIVESIQRWIVENPAKTVAVLSPRNERGIAIAKALRNQGVEVIERLQSTTTTLRTAGTLETVLAYLSDPKSAPKLAKAFRAWRQADTQDETLKLRRDKLARFIQSIRHLESFLSPAPGGDWLGAMFDQLDKPEAELLDEFRRMVNRWQLAIALPIDQLILTISQDLFAKPTDLALVHKFALVLRRARQLNPDWRMLELTRELSMVANNERRFLGFGADEMGFNPDDYKGKVVVTTLHKAKGLEWDRVYLPSVNNYDYPSAQEYDRFVGEKWFLNRQLDLQAEVLAQLGLLSNPDPEAWLEEGQATYHSRMSYASERLRLFFVGITRAREELVVTWNTGRYGDLQPSLPFVHLQAFWQQRMQIADEETGMRSEDTSSFKGVHGDA